MDSLDCEQMPYNSFTVYRDDIEVEQKKLENEKLNVLRIQGYSKMCRDLKGEKKKRKKNWNSDLNLQKIMPEYIIEDHMANAFLLKSNVL